VLLDRVDQRLVARQRLQRVGQQHALDLDRDAGRVAAASAITWRIGASTSAGFSSGIMRRSS
jgi:hypothetical protein